MNKINIEGLNKSPLLTRFMNEHKVIFVRLTRLGHMIENWVDVVYYLSDTQEDVINEINELIEDKNVNIDDWYSSISRGLSLFEPNSSKKFQSLNRINTHYKEVVDELSALDIKEREAESNHTIISYLYWGLNVFNVTLIFLIMSRQYYTSATHYWVVMIILGIWGVLAYLPKNLIFSGKETTLTQLYKSKRVFIFYGIVFSAISMTSLNIFPTVLAPFLYGGEFLVLAYSTQVSKDNKELLKRIHYIESQLNFVTKYHLDYLMTKYTLPTSILDALEESIPRNPNIVPSKSEIYLATRFLDYIVDKVDE